MAKFTTDTRFLSHSDISDVEDTIVTIKSYDRELMGLGKDAQEKWVLTFKELKKGLGLNKTNGTIISISLGTDEMEEWIGRKIALYVKDDVEFQGGLVSAIRVRTKLPTTESRAPKKERGDPEVLVKQLNSATTAKEVMALIRVVALAELSDEDRESLNVIADQRMDELRRVKHP